MKKIKVLIVLVFLGSGVIKATPVGIGVAQKAAGNFYASIYSAITPILSLTYIEKDAAGLPVYYVFNVNATKGFVIINADDAAHPIIGYSDEGAFVIPSATNNVGFWLQKRKNEIVAMRAHNLVATSEIKSEWAAYTSSSSTGATPHHTITTTKDSVAPLCKTSWDQSPYYNALCPSNSLTGCVATAMAQIMKYWEYPSVGKGSNCYNDEQTDGYQENYGQLCATFDTSHYAWSAMPNNNLGSKNNEIAKLMYDCGVSVDMDYSPSGSGSYVIGGGASAFNSYTTYFGYDATKIKSAYFDTNQPTSWTTLLETDLNGHMPMQFQGTDASKKEGHSWVCDGYSSSNMMHMNWGWGDADDGYYAVNGLAPTGSGFEFNANIGVIYDITPPAGALGVSQASDNIPITVSPNPSHGIFNFAMPNNNNSYQVKVYNVLGQEVNTATLNASSNAINLNAQAKGVYLYRINTETGTPVSSGRLVIE